MADVATTVRLPEELYERLRSRAFEERRPIAALVRDAVRRELDRSARSRPVSELKDDPLWRAIGTVGEGPADESEQHDFYLYGSSKRQRGEGKGRASGE